MARFKGTEQNDVLTGGDRNDLFLGLGGDDILTGGGGNDTFRPGTGADTMYGGAGDDIAVIAVLDSATPDVFDGGAGRDTIDARAASEDFFKLIAWSYNTTTSRYTIRQFGDLTTEPDAFTFTNVEVLTGSRQDDQMLFTFAPDNLTIYGGTGSDRIDTGSGNDLVYGGIGDDQITASEGRDRLFGGAGDDEISVRSRASGIADGGIGEDTIRASGTIDLAKGFLLTGGQRVTLRNFENISLSGFQDGATVRGNDGANKIDGDFAFDSVIARGGGGADTIIGGDDHDRLYGDQGADILEGATGNDRLWGGAGRDTFRFADNIFSDPVDVDRIMDFSLAEGDRVDLADLDANTNIEGLQDFRFIHRDPFSGQAGEVRFDANDVETRIQLDTNGDAVADVTIFFDQPVLLQAGDFIL